MEKNNHDKIIIVTILSFCIIILLIMPVTIIAGQQSFSKKNQLIESPPAYYVIMFGRIFNPHIENNKLCFKAINVVCLIDELYDNNGRELYYLGWFKDVKIPKYYTELHTFRRIFVHTGCNDLPEF